MACSETNYGRSQERAGGRLCSTFLLRDRARGPSGVPATTQTARWATIRRGGGQCQKLRHVPWTHVSKRAHVQPSRIKSFHVTALVIAVMRPVSRPQTLGVFRTRFSGWPASGGSRDTWDVSRSLTEPDGTGGGMAWALAHGESLRVAAGAPVLVGPRARALGRDGPRVGSPGCSVRFCRKGRPGIGGPFAGMPYSPSGIRWRWIRALGGSGTPTEWRRTPWISGTKCWTASSTASSEWPATSCRATVLSCQAGRHGPRGARATAGAGLTIWAFSPAMRGWPRPSRRRTPCGARPG